MPRGFRFPAPYWAGADLWLLRGAADASWPDTRDGNLLAFGLIAEGATLERAQQEADAVAASLDARFPAAGPIGLRLVPYADTVRAGARPRLLLILGAAVLVLLIVCVNVVNLLLGRSVDRHRELAARAALGAGRARLVRQLITETVLLFATGGHRRRAARDLGIARDRVDALVQHPPHGRSRRQLDPSRRWRSARCCRRR